MFQLKLVPILVTQIARADRSLKVVALIAVGGHQVAARAGQLAPNRQMDDVDLTNQVERSSGISRIAYGIEEVAIDVVSVISELQVRDVLRHWHGQVSVYLSHEHRDTGTDSQGIRQNLQIVRNYKDSGPRSVGASNDLLQIASCGSALVQLQRVRIQEIDGIGATTTCPGIRHLGDRLTGACRKRVLEQNQIARLQAHDGIGDGLGIYQPRR